MSQSWRLHPSGEIERFAETWELLRRDLGSNPLLHLDFVIPLLEHLGTGHELLAVYGHPHAPDAMAFVVRSSAVSWQTFQPAQAPIGIWMARPTVDLRHLSRALLDALPGMPAIVGITQQDPLIACRPIDGDRLDTLDYIQTANVTVNCSFEDYWQARGKNLRRNMKRHRARLEREGVSPRLETIVHAVEVDQAIANYAQLETAGWKAKGGTAISVDNPQGCFYRDMLKRFCRRGAGRIYRYWFNDRVVAMDLCIEEDDTVVMLKTTYDESIDTVSPGLLMREEEFRQIFASQRTSRVEFYGRMLEWQTRWTAEARTLYHVNYYRWSWLARLKKLHSTYKGSKCEPSTQGDNPRATTQFKTNSYKFLDSLPAGYQRLFERSHIRNFFVSLPWFKHFAMHLTSLGQSLRVYGLETLNGDAQPIAALLMSHPPLLGRTRVRRISAAATYYTPFFTPLVDAKRGDVSICVKQLAGAVADDPDRWDVINIFPLDRSDACYDALLAGLREHGLIADGYFHSANWYLDVAGRTFEQYVESLPSALQNTLRRKRRQLDRIRGVRIAIVTDPDEAESAIEAYEQVYEASWKKSEPFPDFIRGLVRMCAENGWLRLGLMYLDDRPVAAQIWIVYEGVASIYKLAYDKAYVRLSAGSVLTAALLQRVIDVDHVAMVDYLTGDDTYKKDWMSHRTERWGVIAFNLHSARGVLAASHHFARGALRRGRRVLVRTVDGAANRLQNS
jgi:CelD/BcsL family acetyltransferase involved in cellulose biosynthesis